MNLNPYPCNKQGPAVVATAHRPGFVFLKEPLLRIRRSGSIADKFNICQTQSVKTPTLTKMNY
jgi:hypothetical protein